MMASHSNRSEQRFGDQPSLVGGAPSRWQVSRIAILAALGLAVAACTKPLIPPPEIIVGAVPETYRANHPIAIEEMLAILDVPVGLNNRALPRGMADNIAGFATRFLNSGSQIIAIVLPVGSANTEATGAVAFEIEDIFVEAGVPLGSIQYRSYPANANEIGAPIRLAFAEITATASPCGAWTDDLARNYDNVNYRNFGCATQYNLAAMVANPLDLLYPRVMTSADAARRYQVLQDYQNGTRTDTNYSPEVSAGVAEVN